MTLIEIMVVVAILGLMATVITVFAVRQLDQSRVDTTKVQMHEIQKALDLYKVKKGQYPTTEQGIQELVSAGELKSLPKDAWGRDFEYIRASASTYTIKSYGNDGAAGGEGFDADLVAE
jgi:general secretion pathway protein G